MDFLTFVLNYAKQYKSICEKFMSLDKKSQNKAKRPNIFFKAKQEIKKPKSSYLAAKKPSYQP